MTNPPNTSPLDKPEKETLRQWLLGHVIRDKQTGEIVHHRIWFKMMFNPFLRKHGWVIATNVDDETGKVLGYVIRKYNKNGTLEPSRPDILGG
jgi:uncharacterized protein (DUF111 family)